MLYTFSVLPTPEAFIKQLNTIIYNFLWKGPDKMARLAVINNIEYGGLKLADMETSIKSLRLAWLGRIFAEGSSPWKSFINYLLKDFGGIFLFRCNYDVKDYVINSTFYKELLQWWADFRAVFSTTPPISESIIWNNKNIKIDCKTIHYPHYVEAGILICKHMLLNMNNLESYNSAKRNGLKHTNFLVWTGIRQAIPQDLKLREVNENELKSLEFQCGGKLFHPLTSRSKQFYELLISEKAKVSRGFSKWKEKFGLDDTTVSKAFLNVRSTSSETFVRSFQFKILNDITFTNHRLAKIGYIPNDLCTFCGIESETVSHLFYECPFTSLIWNDFASFWFSISGKREDLTLQDVLLGKLDTGTELLNYFIILIKLHIWISRKHGVTPNFNVFKEIVKVKFRTEKYLALKNNTECKFRARWQPYINSTLVT